MKKSILYLKGLIEGFAINSEDPIFEWQHFKDVTYHAQILAFDRHLDENLTLLIACGHDLGRVYGGINGKGHAKESAKILKKLLIDNDYLNLFSKSDIKIVMKAIENHSKKHRVDDAYSELIKDADTLAHSDEKLLLENDEFEGLRYRALMSSSLIEQVAPIHNWVRAFEKLSGVLAHEWQNGFSEGNEIEWVHHLRTTSRKLRSIIVVFKALEVYFSDPTFVQKMTEYEVNLVKVLKHLENARRLAVLMSLEEYDLKTNKLNNLYLEELNKLHKLMDREMTLSPMISLELVGLESWQENCQKVINTSIRRYIESAAKLNAKSIKKIHKVRILGKQLKYLFDLGLIENSNKHLRSIISEFHDLAGDIHDLSDAIEFEHAKQYFDVKKLRLRQANTLKCLNKYNLYFIMLDKEGK